MARRHEIDQKELKAPDAFMESVGVATTFIRENKAQVLGAVVGVVTVFSLAVWWNVSSHHKLDTAAAAFMRATDALESDNLTMADAALKTVTETGAAPYSEMAALYGADILMRRKSYSDAAAAYKDVAAHTSTRYLRQIAMVGQAHALENQQLTAEALAVFEQAAEIDGPYRETALRGQLRSATSAGTTDKAIAAIEEILERFPDVADADALSAELAKLRG